MTSQGRVRKQMDASTTSRKCKQREQENVTLGSMVDRFNLASEKMVANNAKKVAILDRLQQASAVREVSTSGEVRDPHKVIFEIKSMRKSLQSQLKIDGYKTPSVEKRLKQLSTGKQPRGERGSSAKSLEKALNSSIRTVVLTKRNEEKEKKEKEKMSYKKESRGTPSSTKNKQISSCLNEFTRNVYSRHMVTATPRITVENNAKDYAEMSLGKNSTSIDCTSLKNETPIREIDHDNKSDLENVKCGSEEESFSPSEVEYGVLDPEAEPPPKEISLKENEVLNRLTDPQLKESLQNIIKRRRSSVRFVRSESGYDIANIEKKISEQQDATADQYRQEQREKLAENLEDGDVRSVKSASSRRVSVNRERSTGGETVTYERNHVLTYSPQPRTRTRKLARQEQRVPTVGRISSARSCVSTTSIQTQRSVSPPIHRRRKPEIQTGETRVIRPATTKGYVPTLTYKKVSRKQSALSCPAISQHRDEAKNLAQVNMIREFLLMYAKVTTKKEETLPKRMPVRMMSQTPEFVIKSAIGQFLTRAFPSGESEEWTTLNCQSKKERYEDQQRSKLLRIKICMKHLASVT